MDDLEKKLGVSINAFPLRQSVEKSGKSARNHNRQVIRYPFIALLMDDLASFTPSMRALHDRFLAQGLDIGHCMLRQYSAGIKRPGIDRLIDIARISSESYQWSSPRIRSILWYQASFSEFHEQHGSVSAAYNLMQQIANMDEAIRTMLQAGISRGKINRIFVQSIADSQASQVDLGLIPRDLASGERCAKHE